MCPTPFCGADGSPQSSWMSARRCGKAPGLLPGLAAADGVWHLRPTWNAAQFSFSYLCNFALWSKVKRGGFSKCALARIFLLAAWTLRFSLLLVLLLFCFRRSRPSGSPKSIYSSCQISDLSGIPENITARKWMPSRIGCIWWGSPGSMGLRALGVLTFFPHRQSKNLAIPPI